MPQHTSGRVFIIGIDCATDDRDVGAVLARYADGKTELLFAGGIPSETTAAAFVNSWISKIWLLGSAGECVLGEPPGGQASSIKVPPLAIDSSAANGMTTLSRPIQPSIVGVRPWVRHSLKTLNCRPLPRC